MGYLTIDLGSTNIKVIAFDNNLFEISQESIPVSYDIDGDFVEFDIDIFFDNVLNALKSCINKAKKEGSNITFNQIILTGQAESLVILDSNMKPLCKAISWLDNRSKKQAKELSSTFSKAICYKTIGDCSISTTPPITKMLWLKENNPDIFNKVHKFCLLKDYIIYRLTSNLIGEYTCYNFSGFFDYVNKSWWNEILDYCKISVDKLPSITKPCEIVGTLTNSIASYLDIATDCRVNCGALDHFCGMIGTGNIKKSIASESTGTVLAVATMVDEPCTTFTPKEYVPCFCSAFDNKYVLLGVCESGGASLSWYQKGFMQEYSLKEIDDEVLNLEFDENLIFIPCLDGICAPDYNQNASGVFYGIKMKHTKAHFAYAVMEGIAHLLKTNIDALTHLGIEIDSIISTGGGSKSDFWCQLKADITGLKVMIPNNKEASCLGCAIIGAVCDDAFSSYELAVDSCVSMKKVFYPSKDRDKYKAKHQLFCDVYNKLFANN